MTKTGHFKDFYFSPEMKTDKMAEWNYGKFSLKFNDYLIQEI